MSTVFSFQNGDPSGNKVAAFDLDDTLVSAQAITPYPNVLKKLKNLIENGYVIVIISNQKMSHIGDKKLDSKIKKVAEVLDIPFVCFCARDEDKFRKPNIGIFSLIPEKYGKAEFYVGDAAGREGDHNDCDLNLAKNAKIKFYTPEEYFNTLPVIEKDSIPDVLLPLNNIHLLTMVILIGYPASGKSTYAKLFEEQGYVVCNNDTTGSGAKTLKLCESTLKTENSVVIDNLNNTVDARSKYLKIADKYGAMCVAIHLNTSMGCSRSRNSKRTKKVPDIVFYSYRKYFQIPSKSEGFDDILTIL